MKFLTLLASAGVKPEWNGRESSAGHQAIPLASVQIVQKAPMIWQLIQQLGLEVATVVEPDAALMMDFARRNFNVFHVPEAVGSPYLPDQADFVIPFGIHSVVGFGGMLPSGNLFAVILFSRVHLSQETAKLFKPLAISAKLAILSYPEAKVFA